MEREKRGSRDAGDQRRELSAGVRAWRGVLMTSGRGATAAHGPHPPIWLVSKIVLSGRRSVLAVCDCVCGVWVVCCLLLLSIQSCKF